MMKKEKFDIKKLKKIPKEECFICNGKISESEIIFEDDKFIAFLDQYPPTKGHTILTTKKHIEDIIELSQEEYLKFQGTLLKISEPIKKSLNPKRICLLNSGGLLCH